MNFMLAVLNVSRYAGRYFFALLGCLGASLFQANALAADEYPVPLNLVRGVTPNSHSIYDLHMMVLYVCAAIGFVVFSVMLYSVVMHRKSRGVKPAKFHENLWMEITWTIIPIVILVAMAIPAAKVLVSMERSHGSDLTVKVTGYQWKWQYEYIGEDVSFFSSLHPDHSAARRLGSGIDVNQFEHYLKDVDNPLVLPVGKKVRFLHTSGDVIHSWWVPDLGVKKDAIPGFIRENWALIQKEGVYRGKCAELCGRGHGFMPVVVKAVPPEEFDTWLEEQRQSR